MLERSFPERVEAEPETLGRHLAAAALAQRAIPYWLTAGRRALQRSAMKEAIGALSAGIGLLAEVRDETARMELEFELQYALGLTCAAAKGYAAPEVEAAFSRAHALCPRIARTAALTPAVRGLWRFHWVRGNLLAAKALVLQLLQDADTTSDDELSMVTHGMLGGLLCYLGELSKSKRILRLRIVSAPRKDTSPPRSHSGRMSPAVRGLTTHSPWLTSGMWTLRWPLLETRWRSRTIRDIRYR